VGTAQAPTERTPLSQMRVNASTLDAFLLSLDVHKTYYEIEEMLYDASLVLANAASSTSLDVTSERVKVGCPP
jgi:hypothetical protein